MTKTAKTLIWAWLVVLSLAVAGCWGAMKTSPDNPTGAGGLTPNVEDKDAGLVALAPGFDVRSYGVIAVDRFPVTDLAIKDEDDRKLAAEMQSYLQSELVRRLRDTGLFRRVVNLSEAEFKPEADKALRLEGTITRLGGGSQAARAFFEALRRRPYVSAGRFAVCGGAVRPRRHGHGRPTDCIRRVLRGRHARSLPRFVRRHGP